MCHRRDARARLPLFPPANVKNAAHPRLYKVFIDFYKRRKTFLLPNPAKLTRVKLHRNLATALISALESVFEEHQVAARALENLFAKNPKWGKRDRGFVAENLYEIVRWRRQLEFGAQSSDNWALLAAQLIKSGAELPDWSEFAALDTTQIRARLDSDAASRTIKESIPDWLDELGAAQLGAKWEAEIAALNGNAPVVLRANALKISRDNLQNRLRDAEIETETVADLPDALQLETRRSIAHLSLYKEGFFEFQDAASQLVAPFVEAQSGAKILDACAGAGGKSLHLAALLGNRGHIVASDVSAEKLIELRRRASRNGVSCLETRPPQKLGGEFDRVLIDAPCSGLGTLRRQPDLKWRLTADFLAQIEAKQREILGFYAPRCKSGGKLVYATCSILPSENERQIEWFLGHNAGWELEESRSISVAETGFDGFYMARLRRL